MQEGRRKVEGIGSVCYHITLWKKIGSDSTFWNIEGLVQSVFAKSPNITKFNHSDTQMQTLYYYITEVYPVLKHWWVVYAILLLCWSTACVTNMLSYTQQFYIAEFYPILTHCLGIPNIIILLR